MMCFKSMVVGSSHGLRLLHCRHKLRVDVLGLFVSSTSRSGKFQLESGTEIRAESPGGLRSRLIRAKTAIGGKVRVIARENIWTIPNVLCLARIAVCPYLGFTILSGEYMTALGLFVAAGLSDLIDGHVARTYKSQSSVLGTLLDPLADKFLVATIYLSLTTVGLLPSSLTALVLGRDVLLTTAAAYLRLRSLPSPRSLRLFFDPALPTVKVRPLAVSKLNTVVQVATAAASLAAPVVGWVPNHALTGLWVLTALTTVASFLSYARLSSSAYKLIRETKRKFPP